MTGDGESICAVRTTERHVVLTYDDGPEPGATDVVLETLAEQRASATFFVLLTKVRRHPRMFAELAASGHEIALHGMDHRNLINLPPAEVIRRTVEAKAELEDAAGRPIRWIRPPYGAQTIDSWRAVTECGLTPVLWGTALLDWKNVTTEHRLAAVSRGLRAGAIVLAHDGFAGPADGVADGVRPIVDRKGLNHVLFGLLAQHDLVAHSLTGALTAGQPVLRTRLLR